MSVRRDEVDRQFMRRALRLAERGRGRVNPNPMVGAVVVRGGRVLGEGWHRALGEPHAEAMALARAGSRARGATMYVTLEPCAHTGRTPPCVEALVAAGIRRCVVSLRDPHRIVDGRGLRRLRAAGIQVEVGVLEDDVRRQLAGYLSTHTLGRPRVTLKLAVSLDGRIAPAGGFA
ncbi:MAG: bifunctional diaminohydroxyphosphoribosylaminopyrimidine deaminase/5-amino-6-(5-phosphoribosylamino)uracil reductase RibD, partial [Candidatus Eiseniibacteriota bacterium]